MQTLPLMLLDEDCKLEIFTTDNSPKPQPGDRLLFLVDNSDENKTNSNSNARRL